ncbi:MAG: type IV pilin protein [Woeseiaceae bacterium]
MSSRTHYADSEYQVGFSLVELLIVVTIIGVISSIALPAYQRHVQRSERTDARAHLYKLTALQEQFFIQHGHYASNIVDLGFPAPSLTPNGKYHLSITRSDADGFVVRATRTLSDRESSECLWFELDQFQTRSSSPQNTETCWMR